MERYEVKILETPEVLNRGTCLTQLPNGKLFCHSIGDSGSGYTLLIDENYQIEVLPSGNPCNWSSAIYYDQNIYCFGGSKGVHNTLNRSRRFGLLENEWYELTPMLYTDKYCTSVIFNENILVSGFTNKNLLRYSISANSFTSIPYEFGDEKIKILINAERLHLIECNGWIYESEIGSDTAWRRIEMAPIYYSPDHVYCAYSKKGVHFAITCSDDSIYYRFNLKTRKVIKLISTF